MGLFSKIGKSGKKIARKVGKAHAPLLGIATGGLIKPKNLGLKSSGAKKLYRKGGKIARVGAVAAGGLFAVAGAPVALGGAGIGKGGIMAAIGGMFSGNKPGLSPGRPSEPETTFGGPDNQRLETLGNTVPEGGSFGGFDPKLLMVGGLVVAIGLAAILLFRKRR